jgi:homoserine O-acetyltransferase/O-succinyltransferase
MSPISDPTYDGDFTFAIDEPFALKCGANLQPVTLRYTTYGRLNAQRDNAILVCHALSGSSRVADWWPELFGPDKPFDTSRYFIICSNVIGSCYGSTGPRSINPLTNRSFKQSFPMVTIADMVKAQRYLLDYLKIERLHAVVGGSIGGMQAMQWAVDYPERLERCIAIAATPLSAMGLALNHLQRHAIYNDPAWSNGNYPDDKQPVAGLALARSLAMCSYKSAELFTERFHRQPNRSGEDPFRSMDERFDIAGYLDYQGTTFTKRFDANSYVLISKAMDTFDLAHGYESERAALSRIQARTLLVGISSDWLFPASDVESLADRMQSAGVDVRYAELESSHGHDGFLADATSLIPLVSAALDEPMLAVV